MSVRPKFVIKNFGNLSHRKTIQTYLHDANAEIQFLTEEVDELQLDNDRLALLVPQLEEDRGGKRARLERPSNSGGDEEHSLMVLCQCESTTTGSGSGSGAGAGASSLVARAAAVEEETEKKCTTHCCCLCH
jgi:hypothetical protein